MAFATGTSFFVLGSLCFAWCKLNGNLKIHAGGNKERSTKNKEPKTTKIQDHLKQHRSAVDIDRLAIDAAAVFRGQQQRHPRDFFGSDQAILRAHAFEYRQRLV